MIPLMRAISVRRLFSAVLCCLCLVTERQPALGADARAIARAALPLTVSVEWKRPAGQGDATSALNEKKLQMDQEILRVYVAQQAAAQQGNPIIVAPPQGGTPAPPNLVPLNLTGVAPADSVRFTSGTLLHPEGWIVTFLGQPEGSMAELELKVRGLGRKPLPARMAAYDLRTGLALLQVELPAGLELSSQIKAIRTDSDREPEIGEEVFAVASSQHHDPQITGGIVSSRSRPLPAVGRVPMIQADVRVASMSAGGSLLDTQGHLLGIIVAITAGDGTAGGSQAAAVPGRFVNQLLERGLVADRATIEIIRPGFLGIQLNTGEEFDRPLVTSVMAESPASAGGLREKDKIVAVGGREVNSAEDVVSLMASRLPNEKLTVIIERDSALQSIDVVLREFPQNPPAVSATAQPDPEFRVEYVPQELTELIADRLKAISRLEAIQRDEELSARDLQERQKVQSDNKNSNERAQRDAEAAATSFKEAERQRLERQDQLDRALRAAEKTNLLLKELQNRTQGKAAELRVERSDLDKRFDKLSEEVSALREQIRELTDQLKKSAK